MSTLMFFKIFPFPNYSRSLPIQEKLYELDARELGRIQNPAIMKINQNAKFLAPGFWLLSPGCRAHPGLLLGCSWPAPGLLLRISWLLSS